MLSIGATPSLDLRPPGGLLALSRSILIRHPHGPYVSVALMCSFEALTRFPMFTFMLIRWSLALVSMVPNTTTYYSASSPVLPFFCAIARSPSGLY